MDTVRNECEILFPGDNKKICWNHPENINKIIIYPDEEKGDQSYPAWTFARLESLSFTTHYREKAVSVFLIRVVSANWYKRAALKMLFSSHANGASLIENETFIQTNTVTFYMNEKKTRLGFQQILDLTVLLYLHKWFGKSGLNKLSRPRSDAA